MAFVNNDEEHQIEKSNLKNKCEYKLKLFHPPNFVSKSHEINDCLMRCDVLKDDCRSIIPNTSTTLSVLNGQMKSLNIVPASGILIRFDQMALLSMTTCTSKIIIKLSFYIFDEDKKSAKEELAVGYLQLGDTETGDLDVFMTATNGNLLAIWPLKFLIIKPIENNYVALGQPRSALSMHKPLFIGHRGHGTTFSKDGQRISKYLENTIGAFQAAYDKGIKLVEFDVQLSKDNVPVVYHDFKTHLRVDNCGTECNIEIPIQHLNYNDLISNQFQLTRDSKNKYDETFYNEEKHKLFSKLEHLFKYLPEDLSFDVEIKYSMALQSGAVEDGVHGSKGRNDYVDAVLKVCFEFVGKRCILFSSFDPDVCSILKAKQVHFPVMLISQGTCDYEEFEDPRTKTLEKGIHFAAAEQLFGVVMYSTPLLNNKQLIKQAQQLGLKVFTWGEKNNENDIVKIQTDLLVDAIALDNLDMLFK